MGVPVSQMWTVATLCHRAETAGPETVSRGADARAAVALQSGLCGLRQDPVPGHVLKTDLTPEQCFKAVDECGTPLVSIPGGEPLMHPQIAEIVEGLVARKKYVYLCTNGLLLKEKIDQFKPSKYFSFVVHMDGLREHHDFAVCREGTYDKAVEGIREALERGFRLTTNTTLFDGADPKSVREFFDEMMDLGVEGMMLSPGYTYDKAPDQDHFLSKKKTRHLLPPDLEQSPQEVALQHEPAVSRVPDGAARVQVHALGHADV